MTEQCNDCCNEYERIAQHWALSSCDYPEMSDYQHELVTGLLMSDGCVSSNENSKARLRVVSTDREFLEWIDSQFPQIGSGIGKKRQNNSDLVSEYDLKDVYTWHSKRHPVFEQYEQWYESGEKVWPDDIDLTPATLAMLHAGDGHFVEEGRLGSIQIAMANEHGNEEKIEEMFERAGFEVMSWYRSEREDGSWNHAAVFSVDDTEKMFEYMIDCPPGMERKWP